MKSSFCLLSVLVVVALCLHFGSNTQLGIDVSYADALTVVGGDEEEDCGDTFGSLTSMCTSDDDEGIICSGEEVLCSSASVSHTCSTGTGDRAEKNSYMKYCEVCSTESCGDVISDVYATKAADCDGES